MKLRSKFNHGFTNHDYLHRAILKVLHNVKAIKVHEARDNQFLFEYF